MTNYLGLVSSGSGTDFLGQAGGGGGGGVGTFLPLAGGTMTGPIDELRTDDTNVHLGQGAGSTNQSLTAVAIGYQAGEINQGDDSICIGYGAGRTSQAVNSIILNATGANAQSPLTDSINLLTPGMSVGFTPAQVKVTGYLDMRPTFTELGTSTATSLYAPSDGLCDVGQPAKRYKNAYLSGEITSANITTTEPEVHLGQDAGNVNQGVRAVAVGNFAGENDQGIEAVAIGRIAGRNTQGEKAVAIGPEAGLSTQGLYGIAVGWGAGRTAQSNSSIAIGDNAGRNNQGLRAIAIGSYAGNGDQHDGSVIVSSVGILNSTANGEIHIKTPNAYLFMNDSKLDTTLGASTGDLVANNITSNSGVLIPGTGNLVVAGGIYAGTRPVCSGGYTQIAVKTVTNTTAETTLIDLASAKGSIVVPANAMRSGSTSRMFCSGVIDTSGNNEDLELRLYSGASLIMLFPITTGTNITANSGWTIEATTVVKTVGVNGFIITSAVFTAGNDGSQSIIRTKTETALIDTTVDNQFNLTVKWAVAAATNTITAEIVNSFNIYQPIS